MQYEGMTVGDALDWWRSLDKVTRSKIKDFVGMVAFALVMFGLGQWLWKAYEFSLLQWVIGLVKGGSS